MSVRVSLASTKSKGGSKFGIPANFEKLRREYLARGTLFEDPDFPACDASVFTKERPPAYPFKWVRPSEIVDQPKLFVDSTSRFDLKQGELGDCWVVAALASISEHREMVKRVVPDGQSFDPGWYAGMFVFRFWFFNKWTEVIIDDRLPTFKGRLIFIHSHQRNEFWGALVEKAYAKLIGSYEGLKSGLIGDAMADLTSGLTESFPLAKKDKLPPNLVRILFRAYERQSLLGAGINATTGGTKVLTGSILENGLVSGHAYTVTAVRNIKLSGSRGSKVVTLIRVRNPWGSNIEWKGAWSDNSPEWTTISSQDRQAIGLVKADDGEFWMDWEDFFNNFSTLDICHLPPTLSVLSAKRWQSSNHEGAWVKDRTAGGRPFCQDTHWRNPQFEVTLRDSEEDDDDVCTLLVSVMQEDKRSQGKENQVIGFAIYKASPKYKIPYPKEYFMQNRYVATCPFFINARENVGRYELDEGTYIIVPCTYYPNVESRFLLRIFFENAGNEVKEDPAAKAEAQSAATSSSAAAAGHNAFTSTDGVPTANGPTFSKPPVSLRSVFDAVAGSKERVDAYQLVHILNQTEPTFQKWPLSADAGKSLVSLADRDDTFKLEFNEVEFLVHYLRAWLRTFNQMDTGATGSLATHNLRGVIAGMGYRLPDSLIRRFIHRFSDNHNRISVSSFISCLAFIVKVMNLFSSCSNGKRKAELSLDEFFRAGLVI